MASNDWWRTYRSNGEWFPRFHASKACSTGATENTTYIRVPSPWFQPLLTALMAIALVLIFSGLLYNVVRHEQIEKEHEMLATQQAQIIQQNKLMCERMTLADGEVNIAQKAAPYSATCTDSGHVNSCNRAIDGYDCSSDYCSYIANSGVGSWLQINFPRTWSVVAVEVHRRIAVNEQCSTLTVHFNSGQTYDLGRGCNANPVWDRLALPSPVSASWVRITCKTRCSSGNNNNNHGLQEVRVLAQPPSC